MRCAWECQLGTSPQNACNYKSCQLSWSADGADVEKTTCPSHFLSEYDNVLKIWSWSTSHLPMVQWSLKRFQRYTSPLWCKAGRDNHTTFRWEMCRISQTFTSSKDSLLYSQSTYLPFFSLAQIPTKERRYVCDVVHLTRAPVNGRKESK